MKAFDRSLSEPRDVAVLPQEAGAADAESVTSPLFRGGSPRGNLDRNLSTCRMPLITVRNAPLLISAKMPPEPRAFPCGDINFALNSVFCIQKLTPPKKMIGVTGIMPQCK